jgi:hypothetical protein
LNRGIPGEVRWLIKPLIDDLPRMMMTDILDETRLRYGDLSLSNKPAK